MKTATRPEELSSCAHCQHNTATTADAPSKIARLVAHPLAGPPAATVQDTVEG